MRITIKDIKPIHNHIIFEFVDDTAGGLFTNKSEAGLIMVSQLDDQKSPRWGRVLLAGPTVHEDIKVGTYILIEGGMWTTQFWVDSDTKPRQKIWKTDDTKIVATAESLE